MKSLYLIVKIYLKIIFGNKLFFISMILFPILIGLIYSSVESGKEGNVIKTAFVDNDKTTTSTTLLAKLKIHKEFSVVDTNIDNAKNLLEVGKIEGVFVIEKGFGESINKGEVLPLSSIITLPSSFCAEYLAEILSSDIALLNSESLSSNLIIKKYSEMGLSTIGVKEKVDSYYKSLTTTNPLLKVTYDIPNSNQSNNNIININPQRYTTIGGLLMFVMLFLMFGSGWIIDAKDNGTLIRLKSIKNGYSYSFFGTFLCLILAGIFQSTFFLLSGILFKYLILSHLLQFVVLLIFIIFTASMSMFLSSAFKTAMQLEAFTPIFIFLTSFAGGCFWDISLFSKKFELLSYFTPQGLALKSLSSISSNLVSYEWLLFSGALISLSIILLSTSYVLSYKKAS